MHREWTRFGLQHNLSISGHCESWVVRHTTISVTVEGWRTGKVIRSPEDLYEVSVGLGWLWYEVLYLLKLPSHVRIDGESFSRRFSTAIEEVYIARREFLSFHRFFVGAERRKKVGGFLGLFSASVFAIIAINSIPDFGRCLMSQKCPYLVPQVHYNMQYR